MNRKLAFALVAVATVALVTGTGGYSSVNAERGVSVDVVGNGDAFLTLEYSETAELTGTDAYEATFLTIRNRFTDDADLDATVLPSSKSDGLDVTYTSGSRSADRWLAPGEAVDFAAELTCVSAGEQNVTFTIDAKAEGDGFSVNTTEDRTASFDVQCQPVAVTVEETNGTVDGDPFTLLHLDDLSSQDASIDSVSVPNEANITLTSSTGDGAEGYGDVTAKCIRSTNGAERPVEVTIEGSGDRIQFTESRTVGIRCEPPTKDGDDEENGDEDGDDENNDDRDSGGEDSNDRDSGDRDEDKEDGDKKDGDDEDSSKNGDNNGNGKERGGSK